MATIIKYGLLRQLYTRRICQATSHLVNSSRNCGYVKDWKPSQSPMTKEEHEAAAKKYNLIPEDYKPITDRHDLLGDYPDMPIVSQDSRDPYEDLDYHFNRRNYGEPLHIEYDAFTSDRSDPNLKTRLTPFQMWFRCLAWFGSWGFLAWICYEFDLRSCQPVKPKQYPMSGRKHYTFEPAD